MIDIFIAADEEHGYKLTINGEYINISINVLNQLL